MKSTDFPLYTTVKQPHTNIRRAYACIYFAAIMALIFYRIVYIPSEGYLPWILVFCAELGFAFIWILDQAFRWRPVSRHTFPQRLSNSFEEELPPVDIFICTADPTKEPPLYVVNTVVSNLAHHYPTEKLSCYVSDDGGSPLTFYALLEASQFAKFWVPFCRKYSIEQRCPDAYFSESDGYQNTSSSLAREQEKLKDMYEEMKYSINSTVERGAVPIDKFNDHKGFKQWSSGMTSGDHPSIVQVLLEKGKDTDMEGHDLPSLVYVSREKRPGYPHNFKAGALNVLIRVSALMSNAPFILTLDCDMYANNCEALREAMCFFMDSQTGHQLGFVQFPQRFHGITKNDLYSNHHLRVCDIQLKGIDGAEDPFYLGSGCLLRRDLVCGSGPQESTSECSGDSSNLSSGLTIVKASPYQMLNEAKTLAKCSYEDNSLWGKRVGILYGCAVEDMLTGFVIQCKGWKSTLCNPKRNAFQGHVPVNLNDSLVQNTRWAAGLLQFFVSKFCPFVYGINRVSITQRMCYGYYCLWPLSCLPIICYGLVPASCTLSSIALFPEISNPWFLLFTFLSLSAYSYSLVEFLAVGGSVKMWWNEQRMWMIRGVSSCLFGSIQVLCKLMGISEVGFEVTNKVSDSEAVKRYEDEIFEFGVASNMFIPSATLALINLIALMSGIAQVLSKGYRGVKGMVLQLTLVSFIVVNSYPILEAMLVRKDNGRMPTSLTLSSLLAAVVVCYVASYTPSW